MLFNRCRDEVNDVDEALAQEVKEFYLGKEGAFSFDHLDKVIQLFGDAQCFGGVAYLGDQVQSVSAQHIYNYSFEYVGSWRFGELVGTKNLVPKLILGKLGVKVQSDLDLGVCHGDDHFYFFSSTLPMLKKLLNREEDQAMVDKMVRLWINFAQTSTPTPNPGSE